VPSAFSARDILSLEPLWIGIASKHVPPYITDFLDRYIFSYGVNDVGHEIFLALRNLPDLFQEILHL
jgi:hypothetical protein